MARGSPWRWIAAGAGAIAVGLGLKYREEIVSYVKLDYDNVIPDSIFRPYRAFSLSALLDKFNSHMRSVSPGGLPLAAYIDQQCARAGTSPAWIFLSLQREQSLIEMTDSDAALYAQQKHAWTETDGQHVGTLLDYKLRWALGYAAYDSGVKRSEYGGLDKQIAAVAGWPQRKWAEGVSAIGKAQTIEGRTITPKNAATHLQYLYTPHLGSALTNFTLARRYFPELMA